MPFLLFFLLTFKSPEAIIFSLVLVVFQGLLPQMTFNLDKVFTSDALQSKASHMLRFLMESENSSKWSQKSHFLASFRRFFVYALLCPLSHASAFCQNEGLMKIHNLDKFHGYSICGCQVINFQSFPYQSASLKWSFLGTFWALTPPNIVRF